MKLITPDSFTLAMTCPSCPEQYDVYLHGDIVGYIRCRHRCLTFDYVNNHNYTTIYETVLETYGDIPEYNMLKGLWILADYLNQINLNSNGRAYYV